jgi:predicted Zn-dependent protease
MSQEVVAKFGFSALDLWLGGDRVSESSKWTLAALGLGYQVGIQLPFSRDDESAADQIGLTLMAEAGYDPRAAVAFWERMEASGGKGPPEFLSTHPSHATRIERIKQLLPKAIEVYEKSKGNPAVNQARR